MTVEELVDDAEAIGGLAPRGRPVADKKSFVHTLTFPAQQQSSDRVIIQSTCDPQRRRHDRGHRRRRRHRHASPRAEPEGRRPASGDDSRRANKHAGAAWRAGPLASSILADDGRYRALRDISAGRRRDYSVAPPAGLQTSTSPSSAARAALDAAISSSRAAGTGKTWTGARLITDLMRREPARRRRRDQPQGDHNLLAEVERAAPREGLVFHASKKASEATTSRSTRAIRSRT